MCEILLGIPELAEIIVAKTNGYRHLKGWNKLVVDQTVHMLQKISMTRKCHKPSDQPTVSCGRDTKYYQPGMRFNILGQVWFLIVSIPDLCRLSYFVCELCCDDVDVQVRQNLL